MNPILFQQFTQEAQLACLYEEGVYIGKRKKEQFTAILFQLGSFYVEVVYLRYRVQVLEIATYTDVSVLDPYFEEFNPEQFVLFG